MPFNFRRGQPPQRPGTYQPTDPAVVVVKAPLAFLQCILYFISVIFGLIIAILVGNTMVSV